MKIIRFGALLIVAGVFLFFTLGTTEERLEEYIPINCTLHASFKIETVLKNMEKYRNFLEILNLPTDTKQLEKFLGFCSGNVVIFLNPEPCALVRLRSITPLAFVNSSIDPFSPYAQSALVHGKIYQVRFIGNILAISASKRPLDALRKNSSNLRQQVSDITAQVNLLGLDSLNYPRELDFFIKQLSSSTQLDLWLDRESNLFGIANCSSLKCTQTNKRTVKINKEILSLEKSDSFQQLWDIFVKERPEKEQSAIRQEIELLRSEIGDFYNEFLPELGPEWGLKLVRVDYPAEPKYRLPGLVFFVRVKSKEARDKVIKLLQGLYKNLQDPGYKLVQEAELTRLDLEEEASRYLGEGFRPAFGFLDDFFIFSTHISLFKDLRITQGVKGCHINMSLETKNAINILNDMKTYIADSIVNNEYRAKVEPEVMQEMDKKFTTDFLMIKIEEFKKQLSGTIKDPIELDQKIKYYLNKFLNDEKINAIQSRLHEASKTREYKERIVEVQISIEKTLNQLSILGNITISSSK